MLNSIATAAGRIVRLVELKIVSGVVSFRQTGMVAVGIAAATMLAFIALCGLHGALFLFLAPYWGPALALATVSGLGLCLAGVLALLVYGHLKKRGPKATADQIRRQIEIEEQRLRVAFGVARPTPDSSNGQTTPGDSTTQTNPWGDPKVLSAVGIATAGILGPARFLRTVRMTAGIVSTVALVNRAMHEYNAQEARSAQGQTPPPDSFNHSTPMPSPATMRSSNVMR